MNIKEAFNNALRHSGASELWLRLSLQDSTVGVVIEDNGQGFDPEKVTPGGNGLSNIQARLKVCGGRMELASVLGRGTRIRFFPPASASCHPSALIQL